MLYHIVAQFFGLLLKMNAQEDLFSLFTDVDKSNVVWCTFDALGLLYYYGICNGSLFKLKKKSLIPTIYLVI